MVAVPFAWATTPAAGQAAAESANKWSYTINNIRTFFGVTNTGETIKAIAILFRDATGSKVQRNVDLSVDNGNKYIPVYDNAVAYRFLTRYFSLSTFQDLKPLLKLWVILSH